MQMRSRLRFTSWLVAAAAFVSPWLVQPMRGQDQAPAQPARPSVQVGVPEGRGRGGPARGIGARETGPAGPVPRYATGRVMLGGSTPAEKGVWQPGPVVGNPLGMDNIPYQPWARAHGRGPRRQRAGTAHALQGVGSAASVPHAVRRRDPRAARDAARLHLRHRRPAHLPHHLHGRPIASEEPDADLLRPFDRLVGRRHAGRGHGGLQRRLLDGPRPPAPHRRAAHRREVHAHRVQHDALRVHRGRPRRPTPSRSPGR